MEKHVLSKSTFIRGVQCLKSLYLNKNRPFLRDRLNDSQRAKFRRGTDIGILAQQLFPHGIDLRPKSPSQFRKKVSETMEVIRTGAFSNLYEAVFQFDQLLVILDILVKGQKSWVAYEVKSSLKLSETYLMDAAFQYYVITNSGVELEDFFLVFVNKEYVSDGTLEIEKFFLKQSVFREVIERQEFIKQQVEAEKKALILNASPQISIGPRCHNPYPCDFLGHCWKKVTENSLLYLDAFDEGERYDLYYSGKDNPKELNTEGLTQKQQDQLWSARAKKTFINQKELSQIVKTLRPDFPILSLFFINIAVPHLKNTHSYQLIPMAARLQIGPGIFETRYFAIEGNPIELFIVFLRNVLETHSRIIVYKKIRLINFLKETGELSLLAEAEEKLLELSQVFEAPALYHYKIKGDYSAQHVASVFLNNYQPKLNPSLLSMNWEVNLLKGKDKAGLRDETEEFLICFTDFQNSFKDLLMRLGST